MASKAMAGRTGVALALALLCACAGTAPVIIPAKYGEPARQKAARKPVAALPGCQLRLAALKDSRPDPSFLGDVAGREVQAVDFPGWLRGGLEAGLGPADGAGVQLALEADLLKAYASSMPMTKSVDIVMRVRYLHDGASLVEKVYRGAHTSSNWASGDSESQQAFRAAVQSLVTQLRVDGAAYCAGRATPAGTST